MRRLKEVILADLDVDEPNAGIFLEKRLHSSREAIVYRPRWREDLWFIARKVRVCANSTQSRVGLISGRRLPRR